MIFEAFRNIMMDILNGRMRKRERERERERQDKMRYFRGPYNDITCK